MSRGSVLISGAGIAGLSLAYWLRRHGFTPTVVERAPTLRPGGQAIDIRGTAREAVARMGVLDTIRAHHTETHGIAFVSPDGRRVGQLAGNALGDSGGIVAEIEILRGDLVRILCEAAGPTVEYLYDDQITELSDGADGIKVAFRTASPRAFDVVIGADGLRSGVRALAFGEEASLVHDLGFYMAYFPARTELRLDGWELMHNLPAGNGVGGRVALLYPIRDTGEIRAMLSFLSPELPYDRRDPDAQKRLLARVFAGAGWEVPGLLDQLARTEDLYFTRGGEVRVDQWSTGRVALLGDSVFGGSIGMGTSMALVGAYVLAGELAAADGDHRIAFAAYQHEMRDYVAANRKRPPGGMKGFAPSTRRGIWLRNQFMRALPHLPGKGMATGGIQKTANSIRLKDYGPLD
ncbi:NAD(P)-binding protein [Solihabitans fulvus]|uniref:NAD(P)-binding protein n=1 Tax=Solihabitans fulvus TaxID=1892852 RepID=A0A5B2WYI9_9PSEU|nr:FAD-dependent monooxygenase [Solihabitans fulvus]KAA2255990.1 NAD(P)-binding protein [Solihabitans fulvus]